MLIYAAIAVAGLLILGGAALLGGDADMDVDVDVDGDVGADGGHPWLSVKVWAVFAMGFGAAGAIARAYNAPYWLALVLAIVSGLVLGWLASKLINLFMRQQSNSYYEKGDLLGKTASVTLPILEGRIGEVRALVDGSQITQSARSHDGNAIAQGALVEIVHVGSPLIVKPVEIAQDKS